MFFMLNFFDHGGFRMTSWICSTLGIYAEENKFSVIIVELSNILYIYIDR